MHNIYLIFKVSMLYSIIFITGSFAGEVELFIPAEKAEQIAQEEEQAQQREYLKRFNSFKQTVPLSAIHENILSAQADNNINDGSVTITDDEQLLTENTTEFANNKSTEITDKVSIVHENSIPQNITVAKNNKINHDLTIHENSIEFTNFIVHENTVNNKYSNEIATAITPDSKQVWDTASSQASLLFSTSASTRDKATIELVNNGGWFKVAEKLITSTDDITRINGVNLIKRAIDSSKYNHIPLNTKVNKISPILLPLLNDSNSKVRFIAALVLSKLTGNSFNYHFNADHSEREEAITAWNNYIKTEFGS